MLEKISLGINKPKKKPQIQVIFAIDKFFYILNQLHFK